MTIRAPVRRPVRPPVADPFGGTLPWEGSGFGGGAASTPDAILGSMLTLWLDERGQVGSPIDTWTNQKLAAFGNVTASLTERPATGRTINALAAPDFDGTNDRMLGGGPISSLVGATKMFFLAVVSLDAIVGSAVDMYSNECLVGDNGNNVWMGFRNNAGALTAGFGIFSGGLVKQTSDTITTGAPVLIQGWHDGTNVNFRVGASAPATPVACGSISSRAGGLRLGCNGASAVFMNGAVGTLIGCNDCPSAGQIAALRSYVGAKYGVAA